MKQFTYRDLPLGTIYPNIYSCEAVDGKGMVCYVGHSSNSPLDARKAAEQTTARYEHHNALLDAVWAAIA